MEDEKLPLAPPKEDEDKKENPLLDIVEDDLEVEPDSVEVKISIPFE